MRIAEWVVISKCIRATEYRIRIPELCAVISLCFSKGTGLQIAQVTGRMGLLKEYSAVLMFQVAAIVQRFDRGAVQQHQSEHQQCSDMSRLAGHVN